MYASRKLRPTLKSHKHQASGARRRAVSFGYIGLSEPWNTCVADDKQDTVGGSRFPCCSISDSVVALSLIV